MTDAEIRAAMARTVAAIRANRNAQDAAATEVAQAIKAFERQRRRSLTDDERETAADLIDYQSLMGRPVTIAEALNKAAEICARERKAGKTYKRHRPNKKRGKR